MGGSCVSPRIRTGAHHGMGFLPLAARRNSWRLPTWKLRKKLDRDTADSILTWPMRIYTCPGGERSGPHSLEEIQCRLEARALSPTDLAWYEGGQDWIPLSQVPGLKMPDRSAPPRINTPPPLPGSAAPPHISAAALHQHATTPPLRPGLLL